ncbi:nuclear transport factor 2 family protein [Pseudonocardia spinosispora]|uniref:nuclear transport factor 2 family protein n=1 Tax=Pseudonocardia spinosispora TaxID=103441 RepID=UPI00040CC58A|nr:nuclear transport factor 2 family protein [Pseudonocardia spinosispora]
MTDVDVDRITELENARFDAMVAGDFDAFAAVCHPDLMYTHSTAVTDTLESYLRACREGFYVYHRVEHPITRISIVGDTALVLGEMHGELTVGGAAKELHNVTLAVWARQDADWKLVGFQPTIKP